VDGAGLVEVVAWDGGVFDDLDLGGFAGLLVVLDAVGC
jgi:hypothetical protein